MRFILALIICANAFAVEGSFYITASGGSPIPTAYSTSNTQSKVMTGLRFVKQCCVKNGTDSAIAINVKNGDSSTAPSADNSSERYISANDALCIQGVISSRMYIRSKSGSTITSGVVHGFCE